MGYIFTLVAHITLVKTGIDATGSGLRDLGHRNMCMAIHINSRQNLLATLP